MSDCIKERKAMRAYLWRQKCRVTILWIHCGWASGPQNKGVSIPKTRFVKPRFPGTLTLKRFWSRENRKSLQNQSMLQEGTVQTVLIMSTQTQARIAGCARHQAQIIYFIRIGINQTVSQMADKTSREWGQGKVMFFML